MTVRAITIDASRIFNLTSPRWLPQLSRNWRGKRPWHDPRYDSLRDLVEFRYIEEFNKRTGHYEKLEQSILREGFRNPVMLTAGGLLRRYMLELPPHIRNNLSKAIVCEYVGGSRIWVAQKHKLHIPAIVNDLTDCLAHVRGTVIREGDDVVADYFTDAPRKLEWRNGNLYANFLPYTHFTALRARYEREQIHVRKSIINDIITNDVSDWLGAYDDHA